MRSKNSFRHKTVIYHEPSFSSNQKPSGTNWVPKIPSMVQSDLDNSTLFVGNLHPEIDNHHFFQIFQHYGSIDNFHIVQNEKTKKNSNFGFVTFVNAQKAKNALNDLNGRKVFGRELRVMFKQRIENLDKNANLIIKNIDPKLNTRQLYEVEKSFGTVVSSMVMPNPKQSDSGGRAFVQFERVEDAHNFMKQYNGKLMGQSKLEVKKYIAPQLRPKREPSNIYIKHFPDGWDEQHVQKFLRGEFGTVGPIVSTAVRPHGETFFAFVAYKNAEDTYSAIEKYNGWKESSASTGKGLYVALAENKNDRTQRLNDEKFLKESETDLYIRSVRNEVTVDELTAAFERYGKIRNLILKPREYGHSTTLSVEKKMQFGFVQFECWEEAMEALNAHKTDAALRTLIHPSETRDFVFFPQKKYVREEYPCQQKKQPTILMQKMNDDTDELGSTGPNPFLEETNISEPNTSASNLLAEVGLELSSMSLNASDMQTKIDTSIFEKASDVTAFVSTVRTHITEFSALSQDKQIELIEPWLLAQVEKVCTQKFLIPQIIIMLRELFKINLFKQIGILENEKLLRQRVLEAMRILL